MNNNTQISCPECGETIIVNTKQLLQGIKFTCFNCKISIGLASDSKIRVVDTLTKLDSKKNQKD